MEQYNIILWSQTKMYIIYKQHSLSPSKYILDIKSRKIVSSMKHKIGYEQVCSKIASQIWQMNRIMIYGTI